MKAVILSKDGIVLNIVDVKKATDLDLIEVGGLPKLLLSDIAKDDEKIVIGQDVTKNIKRAENSGSDGAILTRIKQFFGK